MKCFSCKKDRVSVSQLHNTYNERNTNLQEDTKCKHVTNKERNDQYRGLN